VRGTGLKVIAASALDVDGVVLRVNSFFWHGLILLLNLSAVRERGSLATVELTSHRSACRAAACASVRRLSQQSFKFI
jgi:hypothetical protein